MTTTPETLYRQYWWADLIDDEDVYPRQYCKFGSFVWYDVGNPYGFPTDPGYPTRIVAEGAD